MGELYVSASEIESFDLCVRKWAFIYVEKRRGPQNDAAALGTRVHKILEQWLKDGTAPDTWTPEGEIAASGLHLLPPPRTPTLVTEEEFRFTSRRAWFMGVKDFRYRDANGLLHVGDHKTTKAFTWAKSTEEILAHPQSLIYAVDEFFRNPNDDRLALDWIYYRTTGARKAEPRFQIVTKDVVAEMFFEHVDPVAGEITRLHHDTPPDASALDFPPDFRACDAFGGCAFLSICNPTPTQRVQAAMTQTGLSLAEKLKQMKNERPASPIHPPEVYQGAPVPTGAQAPVVPQFSVPTPQAAPQPSYQPSAPQAAPHAPPAPQAAPQAAYPPQPPAEPFNSMPVPAIAQPEPAPVAPPAEPKKRGRPKGAKAATAPVSNGAGFTLYIGCAPIGVEVVDALEFVNVAHDQLRESYASQVPPVSHYREILYGKGPAELCKALEALLVMCEGTENAPMGDVVLGRTQIEEDTASVWLSKASKVVRAFR